MLLHEGSREIKETALLINLKLITLTPKKVRLRY